jgi:glucosamine-6-phosphate isomerase
MHITVSKDYKELCTATASFINKSMVKSTSPLLCFAGGDTPLGVYQNLVDLAKASKADFSQARFVGLDEWIGLDGTDTGSCRYTLDRNLFNPLNANSENIYFFNGKTKDLQLECKSTNEYLDLNGPIDIALLGIGVNGHIGFNEPGSSINSVCRVIPLQETTQAVGQKYFKSPQSLESGITLGLKQIMESRIVILIASGEKKQAIVIKLLDNQKIDASIPVSSLWKHPHCYLFLDEAANPKI